MKFIIDSKVFKNITERATCVLDAKSVYSINRTLTIEAYNDRVAVIACSYPFGFYTLIDTTNVTIVESGTGYIDIKYLKRFYNITGEITVETVDDKITVKNSKKKSTVCMEKVENIQFPDDSKSKAIFDAGKIDIVETLNNLSCCLSTNEGRPVFTGYNIKSKNGEIIITTCDSYKLMQKKTYWIANNEFSIVLNNFNVVISDKVAKHFKLISKNEDQIVCVKTDNKYVWFEGTDYIYVSKLIEGEYKDFSDYLDNDKYVFNFEINGKELLNIAKEYCAVSKEDDDKKDKPMYMCFTNKGFNTAIATKDYITFDTPYAHHFHNIPNDLIWAVSPQYLKDIMKVFEKKEIYVYGGDNYIKPFKFVDADGYSAFVLPVRPIDTFVNSIKEYIEEDV